MNNVVQPAGAEELHRDSGYLWFFAPDNIEAVVKVLNLATTPSRASGSSRRASPTCEYTISVTDTQAGRTRRYFNPAGAPFAPIRDTSAFATCP